jgi:hypothetical protein
MVKGRKPKLLMAASGEDYPNCGRLRLWKAWGFFSGLRVIQQQSDGTWFL